jgi:NADPH-dependent 2,4-dienoyl-CoA reductase/sulfur reductase-like enzyme
MTKDAVAKDKNFILCDKFLNTSDENIFAAGDVCSVPYFQNGERHTFGHLVNAQQQGSVAALNMLEKVNR